MRFRRVALPILLPALLSAGCTPGERRPDDAASSTLTILYPGDERTLGAEGRAYYRPAQFLVFEPLFTWGRDGELEPRLARRADPSDDYREWTVHLRTDARWHDGVPVTARDVKFTYDLLRHPDVLLELPEAVDVRVLDDSTVTIARRSRGTYGIGGEGVVYNAIYPEHLLRDLEPAGFWDWDFWVRPVGCGPYRYVRHEPGAFLELEANPDHFRGGPRVDRIVLKFGGAALTELLSSNVDVVAYVDRQDLRSIDGDPRYRTYENIYTNAMTAIVWNHRRAPFRDPAVRRALTLAIDREALHEAVNLPAGLPLPDVVHTARQFRRGAVPPPLDHDPAGAEELLEGAGWVDTDGDGLRERGQEPFRFTVLTFAGMATSAAVFAQQELRDVGVRMEILTVDNVTERVRAGDFDAAILPVFPGGGLSHEVYFGSESLLGYENPIVSTLLDRAEKTLSPVELDRIYAELIPIFLEEQPMTVLYPEVRSSVAHRRVRGLGSPYRAEPTWHADELWLEADL